MAAKLIFLYILIRVEAIAIRVEAIAIGLEAIASREEAIATRVGRRPSLLGCFVLYLLGG